MRILSATNELATPTAIALGNFDGVHRGHRAVLQQVMDFAARHRPVLHSTVVSFNPHPRTFFTGQTQPLLTPLWEKEAQLTNLGVEQLVLLPFTPSLAQLSPQQFVQQVLAERLQARFISVGADFRFGHGRQGNVQDLQRLAVPLGIEVAIAPLQRAEQGRISSSAIRQALSKGDLAEANQLLGRPYSLWGTVVSGQKLGRQLGFPTANLALPADKLWPKLGVYAGWVQFEPIAQPIPAMVNLGDRPTVEGKQRTAEVHLLDWSGELYGQGLRVELHHYLRPEQKFANLEQLKCQIEQDCQRGRQLLDAPHRLATIEG